MQINEIYMINYLTTNYFYFFLKTHKGPLMIEIPKSKKIKDIHVAYYRRNTFRKKGKNKIELFEIAFQTEMLEKILNTELKYIYFRNITSKKLFEILKEDLKHILDGEELI